MVAIDALAQRFIPMLFWLLCCLDALFHEPL